MESQVQIQCPPMFRVHAQKVLAGEYNVPYEHPNPVILDLGANIGSFAIWASVRWPACTLHCYEPMPDNFALLKLNTAHLGPRATINNVAVGDPSHKQMFLGRNNCGECSFYQLGEQTQQTVPVTTVSPEVLPPADILKLDTEGAELEILRMMPRIDFDVILLEYHSDRDRRLIDQLLANYVLVGGEVRHAHRGVWKYAHQRLMPAANAPGTST